MQLSIFAIAEAWLGCVDQIGCFLKHNKNFVLVMFQETNRLTWSKLSDFLETKFVEKISRNANLCQKLALYSILNDFGEVFLDPTCQSIAERTHTNLFVLRNWFVSRKPSHGSGEGLGGIRWDAVWEECEGWGCQQNRIGLVAMTWWWVAMVTRVLNAAATCVVALASKCRSRSRTLGTH